MLMDNQSLLVPDSLVAENIFMSIGKKNILKGMTIRADKGKITGLLGRNGAGKTTMLQAIFGTGKAQECDVFLNGTKIKRPYTGHALINYLPQKPFLPAHVSMLEAINRFEVHPGEIIADFPELQDDLPKKIRDISGGRQRLFSLLIILLAQTRFSLLDEPFSHIMPIHVEQLKAVLLKQKQKKGIIITDHMYRHLLDVSDLLYLVKDGKSMLIKDRNDLALHGYVSNYVE
jgi:ABC-type multidrug transport system ATPase subunit